MKTAKKSETKSFKLSNYFMQAKVLLFFYFSIMLIQYVLSFYSVIQIANCLAYITESNFEETIMTLTIWFFVVIAVRMLYYIGNMMFYKMRYKVAYSMKQDIAAKMLQFTSGTYSGVAVGTMVSRLAEDPNRIVNVLDDVISTICDVIYYALILIYICFLNLWTGLIIVAGIFIVLIIDIIRNKMQKKREEIYNKANDENISLITEVVKSEKDIKGLKLEGILYEKMNKSLKYVEKSHLSLSFLVETVFNINRAFSIIMTYIMLLVSVVFLREGTLAVAAFMYIFTNKDAFTDISYRISHISYLITKMKVSINRINNLFKDKLFKTEKFGNVELENCKGKITFENVSFKYKDKMIDEMEKEENVKQKKSIKKDKRNKHKENKNEDSFDKNVEFENNVFENLSFEIEPNITVAIVGRSGSGKTTIMNLIAKMLEVDSGAIKIDDIDIKELSQNSIRSNITIVNQFPYIFDTTIKENLLMAKSSASDDELWQVLKDASLSEFVKSLPQKLNTHVGEGGVKLSGGQRQRLSIARALLKDSKIILFDESTSSLDNFAQNEIKQSIESLSGERTVVIVAHRLSTIKNSEKIFFLKDGKICGIGTFEKLFNENKEFKDMFLVETI